MKLSVGKKIGGGFMVVLVFLMAVGAVGFFGTRHLADSAKELLNTEGHKGELLEAEIAHLLWHQKVVTQMASARCNKIEAQADDHKCDFGSKILYGAVRRHLEGDFPSVAPLFSGLEEPHRRLHQSVVEINSYLANGGRDKAEEVLRTTTTMALGEIRDKIKAINKEMERNSVTSDVLVTRVSAINTAIASIAAIALILGAAIAFFIRRDITRVLYRLIGELDNNSGQIMDASAQVSTSSQKLAELASEQAASLEEASASMEEMASMTKQNADNAQQAARLMDETKIVVGKTGDQMEQMAGSMNRIKGQGEEVGKIVKTIDEIAFQTNLLALNAAVEAARAGEAGAGFAVVADEVRNLAQRAAEAAKNTSALIEETIKNIKEGHELVTQTQGAFQDVATSAHKVADLVGEIAEASREQAQGIGQINTAVTEMDKTVQNNAASAEESASAAEELSGQARSLKDMVAELADYTGMVTGGRLSSEKKEKGASIMGAAKRLIPLKAAQKAESGSRPQAQQPKTQARGRSKKPVKPEEVIPLEDDEGSFKNF